MILRSPEEMRRSIILFFKQKTAYELRISDWSSDVCSSDLPSRNPPYELHPRREHPEIGAAKVQVVAERLAFAGNDVGAPCARGDRKSVVSGKSVSVRVDLGGRRLLNKKTPNTSRSPSHNSWLPSKDTELQTINVTDL